MLLAVLHSIGWYVFSLVIISSYLLQRRVYVSNLHEAFVSDADEVLDLMRKGNGERMKTIFHKDF